MNSLTPPVAAEIFNKIAGNSISHRVTRSVYDYGIGRYFFLTSHSSRLRLHSASVGATQENSSLSVSR